MTNVLKDYILPRSHNREINKLIKSGHGDLFVVKINRICANEHSAQQISITIKIKVKAKE